ncbi:hypothetical protein AB0K80_29605 [Streptomyces sp. NPDC052682]|uniref:hypothetical protein n=1 Tax=Streptomyces sp. NPDC052682 TaxID=3154954 RepID=UPI00343F205A
MSVPVRTTVSAVLIALSCLLAPCGALAAWAAYGLADTDRYVTAMAPLSADPDVRAAVADGLGAQVLAELGRRLGPQAGQVRATVAPLVRDAARSFTRTETFRVAWDATNRAVHTAVLRALRDDRPGTGPVTVDLTPVAARVQARLTGAPVPARTVITVLPAREVPGLRKGYHVLDTAALWLPLAAVVFAVAGITVAACRRRALTATGLGTALGGALLAAAIALGRVLTLADLPPDLNGPAAGAVYDALTAPLRSASWLLLALGLTVATTAWLTGRRPSTEPPPEQERTRA